MLIETSTQESSITKTTNGTSFIETSSDLKNIVAAALPQAQKVEENPNGAHRRISTAAINATVLEPAFCCNVPM